MVPNSCHFLVVRQDLKPELPYFVGLHEGVFFISEAVPQEYQQYIFGHEATCNIARAEQVGRCLRTTKEELASVPEEILLDYLTKRRMFYRELIKSLEGQSSLYTEISASLAFVRELHRQQIMLRAKPIAQAEGLQVEFLGDAESVGVQGDFRTYTDVLVLMGESEDYEMLTKLTSKIYGTLPINRVAIELPASDIIV
jgi:hypothetical protein